MQRRFGTWMYEMRAIAAVYSPLRASMPEPKNVAGPASWARPLLGHVPSKLKPLTKCCRAAWQVSSAKLRIEPLGARIALGSGALDSRGRALQTGFCTVSEAKFEFTHGSISCASWRDEARRDPDHGQVSSKACGCREARACAELAVAAAWQSSWWARVCTKPKGKMKLDAM